MSTSGSGTGSFSAAKSTATASMGRTALISSYFLHRVFRSVAGTRADHRLTGTNVSQITLRPNCGPTGRSCFTDRSRRIAVMSVDHWGDQVFNRLCYEKALETSSLWMGLSPVRADNLRFDTREARFTACTPAQPLFLVGDSPSRFRSTQYSSGLVAMPVRIR